MGKESRPEAVRTRDKEAKIAGITDATLRLIERKGYDNVTSRDIAREAGVSNGLVFRYFPGGKPAIVRALGFRFALEVISLLMPDGADFDDFPGFLRDTISRAIAFERKNRRILTAISIASLTDETVFEGIGEMDGYDDTALPSYFRRFRGIDTPRIERKPELVSQWLEMINAIILHHIMYPSPFATDEELAEALVQLSLKLWDYEEKI